MKKILNSTSEEINVLTNDIFISRHKVAMSPGAAVRSPGIVSAPSGQLELAEVKARRRRLMPHTTG